MATRSGQDIVTVSSRREILSTSAASGCIVISNRLLDLPFPLLFLAITGSLLLGPTARGYVTSKFLSGIAASCGRHH
jgi:hypothetical protein